MPTEKFMKLSATNIPLVLSVLISIFVVSGVLPATAQQRPLTAADFPKGNPKADESLRGLKGKDLTENLLLRPYDGTALRLAFGKSSPEFLKGKSAEELIAELSMLRAESMKQVVPDILAPLNHRGTFGVKIQVPGAMLHQRRQEFTQARTVHPLAFLTAVYAEAQRQLYEAPFEGPREFADNDYSITGVNEYEYVTQGMTANVREEIITSYETRHIRYRHVKRETVEQNDDPNAVGRHVVEQGTIDSRSGSNTIKSVHPRRLRPTSSFRVTTETIIEAKVERCPTADGLTRGETLFSMTVRGTAAAMSNGAPLFMEVVSPGKATGHVDDAASLTGFDWEVSSRSRHESLNAGDNYQLSQTTKMQIQNLHGDVAVSEERGQLVVSGVGSTEDARKLLSVQDASMVLTYGPLLNMYDQAEAGWRRGSCVELVVPSGTERRVRRGEAHRLVVEARHKYEAPPLAVPVTGAPAGGTLTPQNPVQTPSAAFTFKSEGEGENGGVVKFKSVSRRGIARDVNVGFVLEGKPVYKVTVSYIKSARKDMNMNSDEDRVNMNSSSQSSEDVAYSFSLLHYPVKFPKDNEQIIISAQFPELQNPPGKIIILNNEGYSEYIIKEKPLEATGPFGAVTEKGKEEQQRYFSSAPLPPTVSFIFKNNELIFFSGGVEFPEVEDGLSPVSSSFGIEKDNKKYFPLKPVKVTDPNSPYKWVYEFEYKNEAGYSQQGKVIKQGSKEVETATVQIWKTF